MRTSLIALTILLVATASACAKPRPWTGIVVHHSDSGPKTTRADIDRWHKEKGWDGIGYHYVIEWDGRVKAGRPLSKSGAHAKTGKPYSRNSTHIGICLVGRDTFTTNQLVNLEKLIDLLAQDFDIRTIERHHEQCPGVGVNVEGLNTKLQRNRNAR